MLNLVMGYEEREERKINSWYSRFGYVGDISPEE